MSDRQGDVDETLLEQAMDRYVELERRVDRALPPDVANACMACGGKCCRAGQANQTIRSWWLREISMREYGHWWPDDWEDRPGCVAQGATGCLLTVGRPVFCRLYVCEAYLAPCRDAWEVLLTALLSVLMQEATRPAPSLDLLAMAPPEAAAHAGVIAERIEWAHAMLDAGLRMTDGPTPSAARHRIALWLLARAPAILHPTVADALARRLPDEAPMEVDLLDELL